MRKKRKKTLDIADTIDIAMRKKRKKMSMRMILLMMDLVNQRKSCLLHLLVAAILPILIS
ncbi:hypothetical protein D3C80_1819130 [compost metagenome]